jgi:hypothetical protein
MLLVQMGRPRGRLAVGAIPVRAAHLRETRLRDAAFEGASSSAVRRYVGGTTLNSITPLAVFPLTPWELCRVSEIDRSRTGLSAIEKSSSFSESSRVQ